ncbi:metallophosphoesterase [uncultured Brevundimonas sp.]|uniref:metallophosphoesterase n=1 Tax=uncultured Brevundimonas sp. TaxID=213418 RepID=UPI00260C40D1|nr:metallophosphoesterase [uncultured Brevundimonas sp.]
MKLLWFTDLHLLADNSSGPLGRDPCAAFQACLDHALARHPDADRVIITGDLIQLRHVEAYKVLKGLLADCPIPARLLMGNHDDRPAFLRNFPDECGPGGFVQRAETVSDFRLIYLDTLAANGRHTGELCKVRLNWLREVLAADRDRPAMIFMHHPPADIGIPALDRLKLENSSDFADALQGADVEMILCGHVHRTAVMRWSAAPTLSLKAVSPAFSLDTSSVSLSRSDEPPGYGVVVTSGGRAVVHVQDVK